jgi:hypothetical protein
VNDARSTGLPTLSTLLGDALPTVLADCLPRTGEGATIERVTGGNVSHVFRVRGHLGKAIIKVRTDTFARIPQLRTDPALIADERRALNLYGTVAPGHFPQVLGFHDTLHTMVLSDVFPDTLNYHQHLARRAAAPDEVARLGQVLRRVHHATRNVSIHIRSQGDDWFREHTFDYCLRARGHKVLDAACEEMATQADQQPILGDLAPKNLSLAHGGVALCDLDNVHRSWRLFDVAYFLAHLLIHHLTHPGQLPGLVGAFLCAYHGPEQPGPGQERLMATVAAGVVLYRLDNPLVPYPLKHAPAAAAEYLERVLALLDADNVTVQALIDAASPREHVLHGYGTRKDLP